MGILEPKPDASDHVKRMIEQYREKILGKTALQSAPQEYYELGMVIDMGIPLSIWNAMSINEKAQIMARKYLGNMIEIIDAHYKEQDEAQKRSHKPAGGDSNGE